MEETMHTFQESPPNSKLTHFEKACNPDARVVATCQDDAFELVTSLGADVVLDYKSAKFPEQMDQLSGKFDAVLDCAGSSFGQYSKCLKPWSSAKYITFTSPLLPSTDKNGIVQGILDSAIQLVADNVNAFNSGGATQR